MERVVSFRKKSDNIFSLLTALYITSLLTNLTIGYRYVSLWHFNEAGGIFIFPLSFIVSDMISEIYGSRYAKKLILYGILCELILALYTHMILRMPFPGFFHSNATYMKIMDPYLRFTLASSGAILIGSWLNIYFLSRWSRLVNGKYFILRSLGSSFIGELFVTVSSMLIANFGKMSINQLLYMMLCCFVLKTIISLFAVWPAAFFINLLKKPPHSTQQIKKNKFVKMINDFKNLRSYPLILEEINIEKKEATIFCKGGKVTIKRKLSDIVFDINSINKMKARHASYIGYYYANLMADATQHYDHLIKETGKSYLRLCSYKNKFYVTSIARNKKIIYTEENTGKVFSLFAADIYNNDSLIKCFSSSNACYIGMHTSIGENKSVRDNINKARNSCLKLVSDISG